MEIKCYDEWIRVVSELQVKFSYLSLWKQQKHIFHSTFASATSNNYGVDI